MSYPQSKKSEVDKVLEEFEVDYTDTDFNRDFIKDHCVVCLLPMEIDVQRYVAKGNFCAPCLSRINAVAAPPQGVRRMTHAEADADLRERILWVRTNYLSVT